MKRPHRLLAILPVLLFAACIFPSKSSASTTAVLLPQSDGLYKQLKPKSGTVHYTQVKETRCDGTTTYNSTGTISITARDSYGISVTSVGIGDGAIISEIDIVPCASLNSGTGTATSNVFYRWNGVDSSDQGAYSVSGTTPVELATTTAFSGLNLLKTSTSTLEIGAVMSTTGTKGFRLSRIATVLTYTLTVPAAPTGLAVNNISHTENDLTWQNNATNDLGYKVYRSQDGGSFSQIATTTMNAVSYNDTGVTSGHTYSYKVSAYNSAGEALSSVVESTITISADISSNTTWDGNHVYKLNAGDVTVATGVTLTVQAGAIVKLDNGIALTVAGTLTATGTASNKIYFTSLTDDAVGGDTNGDGTSTIPGTGNNWWNAIKINNNASSTISNAVVRYGGFVNDNLFTDIYNNGGILTLDTDEVASSYSASVKQTSGTSTIINCNIHSQTYDIVFEGGSGTFSSNTIHDTSIGVYGDSSGSLTLTNNTFSNLSYPVQFYLTGGIQVTHSGNTVSGTGTEHGFFVGGTTGANETLTFGDGFPYITNSLTVASGTIFTINPGSILKLDGANLEVSGTLVAEGTTASSIYFTSLKDDAAGGDTNNDGGATTPAAGDWTNIKFDANASSTISHAVVRYGGKNCCGFVATDVYNNGGTLTLDTADIATSSIYGVYQDAGNTNIINCESPLVALFARLAATESNATKAAPAETEECVLLPLAGTGGVLLSTDSTIGKAVLARTRNGTAFDVPPFEPGFVIESWT